MGMDARMLPPHALRRDLHAGFWLRFAAGVLDGLLVTIGVSVLSLPLLLWLAAQASFLQRQATWLPLLLFMLVWWLVPLLASWLYGAIGIASRLQATPGMYVLGLRVLDLHGGRVRFARASARFAASGLSLLLLDFGYFMIGWTARKQALHDLLAGTLVVRREGWQRWQDDLAAGRVSAAALPPGPLSPRAIGAVVLAVVLPWLALLAAGGIALRDAQHDAHALKRPTAPAASHCAR